MSAEPAGHSEERGSGPEYVTLAGIPLSFEMNWPFHKSSSGADFHVLHGIAHLADGRDLRAEFAANISQTVVEVLPSLAPEYAEMVVINAVRMAADAGQLEFLKSGKRQPVPISSRHFDFKRNRWSFERTSEVPDFLQCKVYWLGVRPSTGGDSAKVAVTDEHDCMYLDRPAEQFLAAAEALAREGWLQLEGRWARPGQRLAEEAERFQSQMRQALHRSLASFNEKLTE